MEWSGRGAIGELPRIRVCRSGYFKVVVRLSGCSIGIGVPGVGREVFVVVILFRILAMVSTRQGLSGGIHLFRAHEEEMLYGVSHTRHIICIAKASNIDVDSRSSFIRIRIMDEKGFKLVRQSYDTVGSIIERWSF